MAPEILLDIQPRELKFTVEVNKQSSCAIQLKNQSDQYVAFKVKTTSPKKYCVRPNLGVIQPRETCDFTVVMQAPRAIPSDLHCKDKFLVQSTVVAFGTVEEDLTPETFARDSSKHVEDRRMRVVLVCAPSSPVLDPVPNHETSTQKERLPSGVENAPAPPKLGASKDIEESRAAEDVQGFEKAKGMDSLISTEDVNKSRTANSVDWFENAKADAFKAVTDGLRVAKTIDDTGANKMSFAKRVKPAINNEKSRLEEEFKTLKSKHSFMETKLKEVELTIKKLKEEKSTTTEEKDRLKYEIEIMKNGNMKTVLVGFPFLYVCMVALISVIAGYLIRS